MQPMNTIQSLLMVVDAFREARQVSDARVSTLVFNDGGKIKQLREGRDIGVLTSLRAFQWFSENWPDNASWPNGVQRPQAHAPSPLPAVASAQHIAD